MVDTDEQQARRTVRASRAQRRSAAAGAADLPLGNRTELPADAPERRLAVRLLHAGDRIFTHAYHHLHVVRPWPIPPNDAGILVCNHTSPLDPLFIQSLTHRMITWMMAAEYMRVPLLKWVFHTVGIIPVDRGGRDSAPVRGAMRALDQGRVLGIFPEGRIETTRQLLPFQTGVAMLAIKAGVRVYPAYLDGTQRGQGMVAACLSPNDATLAFGPPLDLSHFHVKKDLQRATAAIRGAVDELRQEVDLLRFGRTVQDGGNSPEGEKAGNLA